MSSKKILLMILIFCLFVLTTSWAGITGKIAGYVKDAETGDPLPGVNVMIEGTTLGASTGLDGSYYIINIPPGVYSVKANMMGYGPVLKTGVLVKVGLTTEVNFALSSAVLDLGAVVEIVAKRPIVQKDLTSGRSVITSEEIKEMPVETFRGVLSTKAGITTGSNGAIHIRGGRSNEIAYLIDGIAMSNPFWGGMSAVIENTAIQELQVVSGTFNAEYGKAMSGIVNIVTKEGGKDYHGNFTTYFGDRVSTHKDIFLNIEDVNPLSQTNFDVSLNGPVPTLGNKVTFFASGRYYNEKGYLYGKREHNPGDAIFVEPASARSLAQSPYNDGRIHFLEPFTDRNKNGQFDLGEPFTDINGDGQYQPGEPFEDLDGNGYYTETEPFEDLNGNGLWDTGFSGDNKLVPMNPYRKFSGQAKITFRLSPQFIFRYTTLYDKIKNRSYSHIYKYNPDGIPTTYQWSLTHKLDFTHQISRSTFYEVKFAHYENDYKRYLYKDWQDPRYLPNILISSTPGNEFYGGGMNKTHTYRNSKTSVLRFDLTSQVNKHHQVKLGFEGRYHELFYHSYYIDISETYGWVPTIHTPETSTSNNMYNRYPREFAAYIQDKIELKDMIINIGLRYDYFNSNWKVAADNKDRLLIAGKRESLAELKLKNATAKNQLSPRLGIAYPITDRGTIHFSYGHFFQMPPFAYLYANPEFEVVSGRFKSVLGNADLKPQQTVIYEIGLQQQVSDDIGIEAIAFYKDINDWLGTEVFELYTRGDYYNRYATLDFGNVKGFTLSIEKRRSGYLSGSLDYTYSVAEGNSSNPLSKFYDLQSIPPVETEKRVVPLDWDQTHTLNFTVTVSQAKKWGISLIGRMGSGLPYTPSRDAIRIDAENSERRPSQMTFDLQAHKDFYFSNNRYATLFIKVYNLFDRLNEILIYSDTGRATYALYPSTDHGDEYGRHYLKDYLTRPNYYSSPRSVRLGMSFGF
ncbi:MAG: TonB-dependent receptor [Calditrichaeota bacterium]|nr:TonB-dependent receptor [Calditrichota bacterium]